MRLSIMPDEGSTTRCDCCGKTSHTAYGYVDDEDENVACGFYLTAYTEQHEPDVGTMIISLGDWSQNKSDDREAVLLHVWLLDGQFQFRVGGPDDSLWGPLPWLGEILPRERALAHARIHDFYHAADHIVAEDPRIRPWYTH